MKNFITIMRESDTYSEFSTKGHADIKVRPNDPRFADNPLESEEEELDELDTSTFHARSSIDKLHDIFARAEVSDQELKQGVKLTDGGMHKIAARLGVGPHEVQMLIAALTQQLRDDEAHDSVEESYRRFIKEAEAPPFDVADGNDDDEADHLSAEPDYLGDVTVRSAKHGKEKYYQGSKAADITDKLSHAVDDEEKQDMMRPLIEEDDDDAADFAQEIRSESGSYNFPWKCNGHNGFGTVSYSTVGDQPKLKLVSIRDGAGDEVPTDQPMRQELLAQAQKFISDA